MDLKGASELKICDGRVTVLKKITQEFDMTWCWEDREGEQVRKKKRKK